MSKNPRPAQQGSGSGARPTIEIVRPDGAVVIDSPPKGVPPIRPPPDARHPQSPTIQPPDRKGITLTFFADAQHQIEARRRNRTYSVEQLRARRHDRELTGSSVMQYHAELQLYRRFMAGPRRARVAHAHADMPVLQHRINAICLRLTISSCQAVLNDLLTLGIFSDVFALSYVNVVFKQAVMNPSSAVLYSMLSSSVAYVLKSSPFADRLRALFLERCEESFFIPKPDTDRNTVTLLRGIATFAGHLVRASIVPSKLLVDWSRRLLESGLETSIDLLITLLLASPADGTPGIADRLAERMKTITNRQVIDKYVAFLDLIHSDVPAAERDERELQNEQLKHSPSIDRDLDGDYAGLFKRSSSIPVELDQMADDGHEAPSMAAIVRRYFFDPQKDVAEFTADIQKLKYAPMQLRTSVDLINAILEQPSANQGVLFRLIVDLMGTMFDEAQIAESVRVIAADADPKKSRKLAGLFANLVNAELAGAEQFEALFPGRWQVAVPAFLRELEQLKGNAVEELFELEFWRSAPFLGVDAVTDKIAKLKEWDIISYFPHFDVVDRVAEAVANGHGDVGHVFKTVEHDENASTSLLFEMLTTMDSQKGKSAALQLKQWFRRHNQLVPDLARRFGDAGARAAALIQ
jgi:hypothetical protein